MLPDQFGVDSFQELNLETPDGVKLHAYSMLQNKASEKEIARGQTHQGDKVAERRPTILFLHANAGNMVSQHRSQSNILIIKRVIAYPSHLFSTSVLAATFSCCRTVAMVSRPANPVRLEFVSMPRQPLTTYASILF